MKKIRRVISYILTAAIACALMPAAVLADNGQSAAVDYGIYYDAEKGFCKYTPESEPLTELPEGMSADGNTLTLSNVTFETTFSVALAVGDGVTVYVPENTSSTLTAVNGDPEEKYVYGLEFAGKGVIRSDG